MRRYLFTAAVVALLGGFALLIPTASQGQGDKTLLKTQGWGSLTGRVVFEGEVPEAKSLVPAMQMHADKACCLAGKEIEKIDNTWVVDAKTRGVRYVLVYLKAPAGSYFPIHDDDKMRKEPKTVDQPHCQFVEHMVGHFPSYFDGNAQVPTGEKFIVKNSPVVAHNIRATGNPLFNPGFNYTLPPGTEREAELKPQPLPIALQCDIHTWMKGWVGVFDHPYFAVTKEDGSFTIPRVPAGAEVSLMAWHEGIGYVLTKNGQALTLKAGESKVPDIKIQKKN